MEPPTRRGPDEGAGPFNRLNDETGEVGRTRGILYTFKDGIVYDARQLLADMRRMVQEAKENGRF